MRDLISRQAAIDAFEDTTFTKNEIKRRLSEVPPAQPEPNYDEWCTDCKEYDHENSCCHRWTKVIRQTRRELQDEFVMTAVDGTLWVTVDDVQKVGRVIVDEGKSKFCRQFYMDAQPEPCEDDPRADVYYLAEKIGINQLYELVVQLRGEPEPCEDAVSRTEILRMINCINDHHAITPYKSVGAVTEHLTRIASSLPPVTPKRGKCKWCERLKERNLRIEYYWIDQEGCTASFSEPHIVATGIAKFCPNCGAKITEGDAE